MDIKPELDQLGVKLVVIGNGSAYFAKQFAKTLPWPGDIYIDPDSTAYKALGLNKMKLWETLKFAYNSVTAFKALNGLYTGTNFSGSGDQLGGVVVVGPGKDSSILYEWSENIQDPGEVAEKRDILEACRQ